jgi:flagellar biosynthesis/type III secretory pathway protein FliH
VTSSQEQLADVARQSQEAFTSALQVWSDTMQNFTRSLTGAQSSLPDAQALVDIVFDFAEQLLATQRQIAKSLLAANVQVAEAVSDQTTRTTRSVTEQATDTARRSVGS